MVTIKKLFGGSLVMIMTLLVLEMASGWGEPLPFAGALPSFGQQVAVGSLKGGMPGVVAASSQTLAYLEVRPDPFVAEQVSAAQSHIMGAYQTGFDLQNYQAGNKKLITPENFYAQGIFNTGFNSAKALTIVVPGYSYGMDSAAIRQDGLIDTSSWAVEMVQEIQQYGNGPNVFIWDWAAGLNPYEQTQADVYDSAQDLAFLLNQYLAANPIHGQIQFIGDNLGALVALTAADLLESQYHVDVDQVTVLDPLECGGYNLRGDYFIDQYTSVIMNPGDVFISPDVNVYLGDTAGGMDAHAVPREWYLTESIRNTGVSDNTYGFFWSSAYGGSRDGASGYYVGYPYDDRLAPVNFNSYVEEAAWNGNPDAAALIFELYDRSALESGGYVLASGNVESIQAIGVQEWLAGQTTPITPDPLDYQVDTALLTAHSLAYLYRTVSLSAAAEYLQVEFSVITADQDSYLAVLLNGELTYYQPLQDLVGQTVTSTNLYVGDYAGGDVLLTVFVDDPDDSANGAQVALRELNFQETFTHDLYYFQYFYSSGDYYSGWFYGDSLGLYEGSSWDVEEAGGGAGFYTITGVGLAQGDAAKDGWVYVDSYYDRRTDGLYTPLSYAQGLPAGWASLGSESDFIIQADVPDYAFGVGADGLMQEADLANWYDFTFTYESGDSYTGAVLATPSYGYYPCLAWTAPDEHGGLGTYEITGVSFVEDNTGLGEVQLYDYYDSQSAMFFTPVSALGGVNYLGSEGGCIIQDGVPEFAFGAGPDGKILEADLFAWYDFTFTFESGDYYTGMVHAGPDYGYYPGLAWNVTDEHGGIGTYEITGVSYYVEDSSGLGEVLLYDYYDAQSAMFFTPVSALGGAEYLGKEFGYILTDKVAQYYFGRGYEEADLVTGRINAFRFTYANGDYYTGTMYADPATFTYYLGYTQTALDENGELGSYEITAVAPGTARDARNYGNVLVSLYFDAESGNTYKTTSRAKPVGTDYLGSEMGYIVRKGVSYLQFGNVDGIHQEADVAAQYSFTFSFGNGDYYQGTVYGLSGDYLKGDKIFQDDETTPQSGQQGYYEITGVNYLGYSKKIGQVTLSNYYDKENNKVYRPLSKGRSAGTYLGGESDYIIKKGVEKYHFGGGFYEADAL